MKQILSRSPLLQQRIGRRRGLALAGSGAATFLVACGGGSDSGGTSSSSPSESGSAGNPKKGGTLVLGFESDVGPLTVDFGGGIVTSRASRHIYEALVERDYENLHDIPPRRPALAKSWEASPDGLTYTFALQDGVKFHDGTPWTAEVAKFNIDRLTDPNHASYYPAGAAARRPRVGTIASAQAIDERTLRVNLKSLDVEFLTRMEQVYMISPEVIRKYGNENYHRYSGGTGSFKLVSNNQGQQAVLERNTDYWGSSRFRGGPFVDKMVISFITEPTVRVAALQSGDADWISVVPPDRVGSLGKEKNMVVAQETIPHTWIWIMNFKNTLMQDKRIRQALALSVDRATLCSSLLRGTAEPAYQFWAPGSPAYRPTPKNMTYDYDPDRARKLLQAAGYSNGLDIRILTPNSGSGLMEPVLMNEYIQQNMAKVGIRVKVDVMEWQSFFTKWREGITPEYASYVQAYPTENMPSLVSWTMTSSQPPDGTNSGWYSNSQLDNYLSEATRTLDEAKRNELYAKAVDITAEDLTYVSVVHDKAPLAWSKRIHGFVHPKSWNFSFNQTWIDN